MGLFLGTAQMSAAVAVPVIIAMVLWERLDVSESIEELIPSRFGLRDLFLRRLLPGVHDVALEHVLTPITRTASLVHGSEGSPWGCGSLEACSSVTCCTTCFIGGDSCMTPCGRRTSSIIASSTSIGIRTRSSVIQALGITFVFCIGFNLMMLDVQHMQIGLMMLEYGERLQPLEHRHSIGSHRMVPRNPAHHRMHHVELEETHDMMFAGVFSFFDRIFGTYVEPTEELLQGPKGQEFDLHSVRGTCWASESLNISVGCFKRGGNVRTVSIMDITVSSSDNLTGTLVLPMEG